MGRMNSLVKEFKLWERASPNRFLVISVIIGCVVVEILRDAVFTSPSYLLTLGLLLTVALPIAYLSMFCIFLIKRQTDSYELQAELSDF